MEVYGCVGEGLELAEGLAAVPLPAVQPIQVGLKLLVRVGVRECEVGRPGQDGGVPEPNKINKCRKS